MKSLELTAAIPAAANAISRGLTVTELAFWASVFVQLGDTLATIAAETALKEEYKNTT